MINANDTYLIHDENEIKVWACPKNDKGRQEYVLEAAPDHWRIFYRGSYQRTQEYQWLIPVPWLYMRYAVANVNKYEQVNGKREIVQGLNLQVSYVATSTDPSENWWDGTAHVPCLPNVRGFQACGAVVNSQEETLLTDPSLISGWALASFFDSIGNDHYKFSQDAWWQHLGATDNVDFYKKWENTTMEDVFKFKWTDAGSIASALYFNASAKPQYYGMLR